MDGRLPGPDQRLSRRGFLAVSAGGAALAVGAPHRLRAAAGGAERVRLLNAPTRVYKLRDTGKENAESWLFHLVLETAPGDELEPVGEAE